ncbi:MAG: hypothetical protein ACP5XB_20845 [Isosphaeraceae bacterium]
MDLQPDDDLEEEGLSDALVRIVQDDSKIEQLRKELGSFSHRCRNVLGGMKMSLYLMKRSATGSLPGWWDEIERNYQGIERLIDELQTIYRPMSLTPIRAPFGTLVRNREPSWREWFASRKGRLEIVPPAKESVCQFDPMCLRMGCDAFLRWRASMLPPGQTGRFSWQTDGEQLHACWQERPSGPLPHEDTKRSPARECTRPSSGNQMLALPLLARVIKAHGGVIQWTRSPAFQVEFGWPLEQPADVLQTVP